MLVVSFAIVVGATLVVALLFSRIIILRLHIRTLFGQPQGSPLQLSTKKMLIDNHGRKVDYLRIAVIDKCNLRCTYCMPHEDMRFLAKKSTLTDGEIIRLLQSFSELGINKVRFTGGEPFVRPNFIKLLEKIHQLELFNTLALTTNGTLLLPHLPQLKELGVKKINLSLDTLQRERFFNITHRDSFDIVKASLDALVENNFDVKINMVVMSGINADEILPFVELTRLYPISMRFIEEMPFNGGNTERELKPNISWRDILDTVKAVYPNVLNGKNEISDTAYNYKIEGFTGSFGIIAAYSRTFCGTCNRMRVTPDGGVKTCLYGDAKFNARELMRAYSDDDQLKLAIQTAVNSRAKDGFEAEANREHADLESMTFIGG